MILNFKEKWLSKRYSESQAFHFRKRLYVNPRSLIYSYQRMSPKNCIEDAKNNLRNVNKWVRTIFNVQYLIQMDGQLHKQDASFTIDVIENVPVYMKFSSKFPNSGKVTVCIDNARNYGCTVVTHAVPYWD